MYEKSIRYDRETRDYAMYLDGELVGFARTHHEAEVTLDQFVFELMSAAPVVTTPAEPATTCVFCSKPHHPQKCAEMRALLFAPDTPLEEEWTPCPDCKQAVCECDIGSNEWNRIHAPILTQRDLIYPPMTEEVE